MAHHYFVRHQVRVNCLAVGTIDTGEAWVREQLADPEYGPALLNYYLGRLGRPEHVAAMAAHLMSHEAEFINGAVIPVDGGATAVANWRP